MSSNSNEREIKMVRIQKLDKSGMTTYDENVMISILSHTKRPVNYLRIKVRGQTIFTIEFSKLQWISESSIDGVATISSPTFTIVIIYNKNDTSLLNYFGDLQRSLQDQHPASSWNSVSSQLNQDQPELTINNLIRSIHAGSLNDTEFIAYELAKTRVNIQFNLVDKNNKIGKTRAELKSADGADGVESKNSVLQLTLRIESQMKRDPIIAPIKVRSGATLQSLKKLIENETSIKSTDQYWFAFGRYPISNEYVFGSSVPVGLNQTQYQSLINPIRSGDTLTMYIAQTSSEH